jgi:hypothetical protein
MGFEGIAQLRKTRLTTLHEIGSKLHSCDLKVFEESNAQARSE